jgi:polar amino acid transport system substrate-binding protein
MRKLFVVLSLAGLLLAACAEDNPAVGGASGSTTATGGSGATSTSGGSGTTGDQTAAACAQANADVFKNPGTLTIGTGNPAYPPWWEGGTSSDSEFKLNDPANGEGYEGAVAKEIAERLGFSFPDQVTFLAIGFNESFAPGPKDFDLSMQQISYKPKRDEAVDFSESYYDVTQSIVSTQGSSIAGATTLAEVKDAKFGAPIGTTSLDAITNVIQPTQEPAVYDDLAGAVQDLKNGAIDGLVVDLPSAFYIAAVQVPNGIIVGQLPSEGQQEYVGAVFETGSPLVACVNRAIDEMRADGTLDEIAQKWLADKANAPVLT